MSSVLDAVAGLADQGADAQKAWIKRDWEGKRLSGKGKVAFSSKIYGKDMDLGVSGGTKVTLEVPTTSGGIISPKVLLHLPEEPPEDALGFNKEIRFSGTVMGYKALGRTLLMQEGRLE